MKKDTKKKLYEAILKCDAERVQALLKQEFHSGKNNRQCTEKEALQFMLTQMDLIANTAATGTKE